MSFGSYSIAEGKSEYEMNSYSPVHVKGPSLEETCISFTHFFCAFDSHTEGRINDVWIALEQVKAVPRAATGVNVASPWRCHSIPSRSRVAVHGTC